MTDTLGGGNGFLVGKNAPDEAIEFLQFITSVKNNSLMAKSGSPLNIIPTVAGAEKVIEDPLKKAIHMLVRNCDFYQVYYDIYLPVSTGTMLKESMYDLFAGTITPEQFAKKLDVSYRTEQGK